MILFNNDFENPDLKNTILSITFFFNKQVISLFKLAERFSSNYCSKLLETCSDSCSHSR
jgi:hypothetical protein